MVKTCRPLFIYKLFAVLASAVFVATGALAQTRPLPPDKPAPTAFLTDPAQLTAKQRFNVQPLTIDKLYMTRAIGDSAWSPDGKQVAFVSNITGRENIWLVSSESGWPTQLTVSNQRQITPAWSPNGTWIAYASDYDGNEQWDLFLVSPQNGQLVNLTNTPEISEEGPVWSPDGSKLAFRSKAKDASFSELCSIDIGSRKVTRLATNASKQGSSGNPIWSRDGKSIVFTQTDASFTNSNIFIADLASGSATNLTPHQGEQTYTATDISPDGKTLLLTSNAGNGYNNVGLLEIATHKIAWLTNEKWETTAGKFSPDGKRLTWTVDIFLYDRQSRQTTTLPVTQGVNTLAGAESPFTRDGSHLLYGHEAADSPNDLWLYDFATRESRQVTHSLVAGVHREDMVQPFLAHYPSKDGKWQIPAFVYVPYNAERNAKNAAVVFIHGGPNVQIQNYFIRSVQYLVNQGFFVIVPTYRGSTEYRDASRFDMGGGDLDDIVSSADWMVQTGFIDPQKIAVMGASYGGYLSMMAVTKRPDRWAAAAVLIPFVNLFTEIENTDPAAREHAIATMGDPMKDKELLKDRSPIYFVDRIKAPVLLLAGGKDPRCPPTEAEQVASAIKKRNGTVDFKVYENEGHGFSRVENQIDAITRVGEFLKKYAPPAKCGCNLD